MAKESGWSLSGAKKGFLVQADSSRIGTVRRHLAKLAAAKVSVVAADAVAAGKGRYGMILRVKEKDFSPRAARGPRRRA